MVEDFYEILGVDPGADVPTIRAALDRSQPAWSSGTRNPKTKHRFQSYLDLIPEIKRALLGDLAARAAYDADRSQALRGLRDARLDELHRRVRLRAAKGGLTPGDRTILLDQATKLGLSLADLDRLTAPIPARPDDPGPVEVAEPAVDVLDAVARKQIRVTLDHLKKRDLYDALGLVRDAPTAEVTRRSDAERRRWMQKSQVTAEKTAWLEAVSHAQSHLGTPETRGRYDRTLRVEAEERLAEAIAFAVRGLTRLDYGTRSALVQEAAAEGVDADRAGVLIGRGCRAEGVAFEGPSSLLNGSIDPPRYLRCRSYSGVTNFDDAAGSGGNRASIRPDCPFCGASLRWHCPSCGRDHWVDLARCGCGFLRENVEPLAQLLLEAQRLFRDRDYRASVDRLQQVQGYVPDHPVARKGIKTASRHLLELDRARVAFESSRSRRHLVAAEVALEAWRQVAPSDNPDLLAASSALEIGLRSARRSVALAEATLASGDIAAARTGFDQALAVAADLVEARQGRLRCPPDPPTRLVAQFDRDRVRLRWTPASPDGLGPVQFRVVRKQGSAPTQPIDGTLIAETGQAEAEDRAVRPGESVAYAVYADRGDVTSPKGANSQALDVLSDVYDITGEVRSGETYFSWTLPSGAIAARVVRNRFSPPTSERDGDLVESMPDGLIDRGLQNDRTYHYAVFAVYRDPNAQQGTTGERLSQGLRVSLVPRPPAQAIAAPILNPTLDGRVAISWATPPRGEVRILRTIKPPSLEPGDRVPAESLAAWGGDWIESTGDGRGEDPAPPAVGLCFYTPVVVLAGEATIGVPARFSCVADPSDLRAVRAGGVGAAGRVHLRWRWSPQGVESRVVASLGRPPTGADDPSGVSFRVFDDEYSRLGYFAITLPSLPSNATGPWHLAVFAVAVVGGEEVVSPGLDSSARTILPGPNPEVTVAYTWKRPGFVARNWSITFHTEPTGSPIPPTALVTHPRTVPLSADDGWIIARFPASTDGATFTIPAKLDLTQGRARIFADPTADPEGQPPIRFRHPDATTRA